MILLPYHSELKCILKLRVITPLEVNNFATVFPRLLKFEILSTTEQHSF